MPQKITVTCPLDSRKGVQVEVAGVLGEGCKALTEGIEKALGTVLKTTETEEYARTGPSQDQILGQGF